jgi:flagellar hook assembly protein FlgD
MAPGKLSCFPNPFNPATTIEYNVPNDGNVTLEVFDVRGALVVRLFAGHRNAGVYTQAWSGTDAEGQPVGSGVYLARLTHESSIHMIKMVLVK